jgi:DNA topoisomerase I
LVQRLELRAGGYEGWVSLDLDPAEIDNAVAIAEEAGLVYVSDAEPGIRRRRCGSGYAYRAPDGTPVSSRDRDRISALAIPPAWRDVWICPARHGHLQATGRDAKGRKQYRYHDRWREVRDADKFSKLLDFGGQLDGLRKQVEADLAGTAPTKSRILALVIQLLDETLIRVGNEEYAAVNESFGLTTLRNKHAAVDGADLMLRFVGKSGVEHDVRLHDRKLASLVRRCHELGGHELFSYRDGDEVRSISSTDVNDWLHTFVGPETTAKTFRTWGASAVVVEQLATADVSGRDSDANDQILSAIDVAAERLRNTRAVCRQSYVHPAVLDAFRDGSLAASWAHSRDGAHLTRPERTLLRTLQQGP